MRTSALVVSTALAASPTPSPKELWEAYPLKSQDSAELRASPSPSASPARAGRTGGGGHSTFLIAGAAVLAFSGGMLLGSLRGRRRAPAAAPREAPQEAAAPQEPATPERAASRRFTPRRAAAEIPAPALASSSPAAAARPQAAPSAPPVPAPSSQTWAAASPPAARPRPRPAATSPPAVRSRPSKPAPPPPPPIFAPRIPWPRGSELQWRCELTWRSGYRRSQFRALAGAPGARRRTVVARSPEFRNLVKDPADVPRPELESAVRHLAVALEAQGWTPVAPGGRWYSRRFVWTHDGPPPGVEGAA